MKIRLTVVALVVSLVGCGGVKRENLNKEYAKALCSWVVKCGGSSNQALCEQVLTTQFGLNGSSDFYDQDILAGKIKYDEGGARRCVDAISGQSCEATLTNSLLT